MLKKIIEEIVDDVSGSSFKDCEEYSEKDKKFYVDRYIKILTGLPKMESSDIGLEVGLAGGVLAFALQKQFKLDKLYTLEHPTAYTLYKKSFLKKLIENKIILESVDLKRGTLPWKDNFFDFIFCCDVLEHLIPSDIPIVVSELKRTLKKGGHLIIVTPNIASLLKRINLLRGKNPIEFDLRLHEGATYGHIREYSLLEMSEIARMAGFENKKNRYFMIDSKRSVFTRIEDFFSKIIPSLSNTIEIILKK
jgi:SAM-dependent methyltransferase